MVNNNHDLRLKPYLSPIGAWAFALGTSLGWGSMVITGNTYLSQAGPLGSVLGLIIGAVTMLVISRSYAYLMNCYPDSGGAYTYSKNAFGYDHGFLTQWFLTLTYFSMLWANATSLPLFARYFFGDLFKAGKMYTLFGYDVYIGEALVSIAAIIVIALICAFSKKILSIIMTGLVLLFAIGITLGFVVAIFNIEVDMSPAFVPDKSAVVQIVKIACISTWAFIGFENISHFAEEFKFPYKKSLNILRVVVVTTVALYVFVILLSVTVYPSRYASWLEYISDLGNLSGLEGLPAFYAVDHYLGSFGVVLLMASLLALILTSLIGNIVTLSRLLFSVAKDRVLPGGLSALNKQNLPWKLIVLIAAVSCAVPFLGRIAIGWIVDVTTLGATLTYGYVAAAAARTAKSFCHKKEHRFGVAGVILMIGFGLYLLIPNLYGNATLEKESFIIFVIWAVMGILFFRVVLKRDRSGRFGHSIIVWVALLSLTLFVSLVWMNQNVMQTAGDSMEHLRNYYSRLGGIAGDPSIVAAEYSAIKKANMVSMTVVISLFVVSVAVLINNYAMMSRRARKSEAELGEAKTVAFSDSLTGVKNKHAYVEIEQNLNTAIENGDAEMFAMIVFDVNNLKYVNDTYGHKEGDRYICMASKLICDTFAHSPVFRIGGDEFVALLQNRDYESREELFDKIAENNRRVAHDRDVVIAAGMSAFRPHEDALVADVFNRADTRMYENKQQLKNGRI